MRPPREDQKLANMPANLLAYFWSNWLDLPAWWQATRANASGRDIERADHLAELVQEYMGMSIEDFLKSLWLANRVGYQRNQVLRFFSGTQDLFFYRDE